MEREKWRQIVRSPQFEWYRGYIQIQYLNARLKAFFEASLFFSIRLNHCERMKDKWNS